MKIVDCFTFYNEVQLLKYRLEVLNDVVDHFVLVESTHTHAGYEKELYFQNNKELFSKYLPKIVSVVVDDFEFKQPNIDFSKEEQWVNERFQRKCIARGISQIELADDDLFMVSDLDEIPDPDTIGKVKRGEIVVEANSLAQDLYYYNLNHKFEEKWPGTKILSVKTMKQLEIDYNQVRHEKFPEIPNGGWHLSYFGDSKFIKNKMVNFGHQEYNGDFYRSIENIEKRMKRGSDVYARPGRQLCRISVFDNPYLPPRYDELLTDFYTYKIAKHITFFYNEQRHSNIEYLKKIIDNVNSYKYNTDIFIHTNTTKDIIGLLNNNEKGTLKQVVHDLGNQNPWYLPWNTRSVIKDQVNDYDIFINSEDDVIISKESLDYWLNNKDKVMKHNYNLGFFIMEVRDDKVEVAVNISKMKNGTIDQRLHKVVTLDGQNYILNDQNTHVCSWIYDKREFGRFLHCPYYNPANVRGYGVCESEKVGLHGLYTDWYKGTLIPLVSETTLHEGSKLYHLPNKYWNLPTSDWAQYPFDEIVKK